MIRWDEPIEAYHTDGRIVAMVFEGYASDGTPTTTDSPAGDSNQFWMPDGRDYCLASRWRIRNVTTHTPPNTPAGYSDEVVGRMVALVRAIASGWGSTNVVTEARAIVALLPEPVDPDEQYARDLIREQGWQDEREIGSEAVVRMIAMARRAFDAEGR